MKTVEEDDKIEIDDETDLEDSDDENTAKLIDPDTNEFVYAAHAAKIFAEFPVFDGENYEMDARLCLNI